MKNKFLIFILYIAGVFALTAGNIEDVNSIDVQVVFQKISHQNPWIVGEPFSKRGKAIHVGKGLFFTVTLSQQKPLFAEFDSLDFSTPKLKVEAYDPETGFTLLQAFEGEKLIHAVSLEEKSVKKLCPTGKSRYVQLPFSKTPIKTYLLEKKEGEDPNFSFSKSTLCGITYLDFLIPTEYVRYFLNETGSIRSFPHPGWIFDVQLTPSEKEYYARDTGRSVLVSESFPGVGPAYSLFPGDLVLSIGGNSLSSLNDWDRYDRVMDLILRDSQGNLKKTGTTVDLTLYRNHTKQTISYKLAPFKTDGFLIPEQAPDRKPTYLIAGGFFFTELTGSYLKEFGNEYRVKSEKKLLYLIDFYQKKTHPLRERIVILSRVFPLEGNVGYQDFQDLILETVNGARVTSLNQLKAKLDKDDTGYFAFEFSGGKIAVFTRKDIQMLQSELQSTYKIGKVQNLEE
ncbi:PDZ domain-containing protein [Leptospira ilyithenensis]|uniref:PDZ domain-containing protein n=1 Tax=Leptospira ilyithenensis TaxID=2484901 RepID=A0A4R9LSW6_9LEPT|nr:PDZ domain-containing protein [Leptospira ilyithenensis]TGN10162.1 PDZ domain-containing protein [Leptospira ilyithenensis]